MKKIILFAFLLLTAFGALAFGGCNSARTRGGTDGRAAAVDGLSRAVKELQTTVKGMDNISDMNTNDIYGASGHDLYNGNQGAANEIGRSRSHINYRDGYDGNRGHNSANTNYGTGRTGNTGMGTNNTGNTGFTGNNMTGTNRSGRSVNNTVYNTANNTANTMSNNGAINNTAANNTTTNAANNTAPQTTNNTFNQGIDGGHRTYLNRRRHYFNNNNGGYGVNNDYNRASMQRGTGMTSARGSRNNHNYSSRLDEVIVRLDDVAARLRNGEISLSGEQTASIHEMTRIVRNRNAALKANKGGMSRTARDTQIESAISAAELAASELEGASSSAGTGTRNRTQGYTRNQGKGYRQNRNHGLNRDNRMNRNNGTNRNNRQTGTPFYPSQNDNRSDNGARGVSPMYGNDNLMSLSA